MSNTEQLIEFEVSASSHIPALTFVYARERKAQGETIPYILIHPGGGYRKVESHKEGRVVARHFASHCEAICVVVHYRLAEPESKFHIRASDVTPSLNDARETLAFIRKLGNEQASLNCDPALKPRSRPDVHNIVVTGFSAGGHLSLCLAEDDGKFRRQAELKGEVYFPQLKALLLVYPTLRNPCCWCIGGGLWIAPTSWGEDWSREQGQHQYCFGSNEDSMSKLVKELPRSMMIVTTKGDLLLPLHKHAGLLLDAMAKRRTDMPECIRHVHGPWTCGHGCGLQSFWDSHSISFLKDVLLVEDTS